MRRCVPVHKRSLGGVLPNPTIHLGGLPNACIPIPSALHTRTCIWSPLQLNHYVLGLLGVMIPLNSTTYSALFFVFGDPAGILVCHGEMIELDTQQKYAVCATNSPSEGQRRQVLSIWGYAVAGGRGLIQDSTFLSRSCDGLASAVACFGCGHASVLHIVCL